MEIGEFLKEQYKEYYPNLGVFTNNSGKDILVKYEKGDKETIIVKNGDCREIGRASCRERV